MLTAAADLSIWAGISSAIFYVLLIVFAGPKLVGSLRRRQEGVVAELASADIARDEVRQIRIRHDAERARVKREADEMIAEGERDAKALRQQLILQATEEIARLQTRSLREMDQAKHSATVEVFRQAVDRSFAGAQGALRKEMTDRDHDSLIDRAIDEMERSGLKPSVKGART